MIPDLEIHDHPSQPMDDPNPFTIDFEQFILLPRDAKWAILDSLPFIDLLNFCSVNLRAKKLCSDPDYFQRRLVYKINKPEAQTFLVANYKSLLNLFNDPALAYTKALIDAKAVNEDFTVLIFMSNSDVLFPGLEYFIGLVRMGVRAINLDRQDYLSYVLDLISTPNQESQIAGPLLEKYMTSKLTNQPFTLVNQDKLEALVESFQNSEGIFGGSFISSGEEALRRRYYPRDEDEYLVYLSGLTGSPVPHFIDIREGQVPESYEIEVYLDGLIDGKHDQLFVLQYHNFRSMSPPGEWLIVSDGVRNHVSENGTVEMMKAVISIGRLNQGELEQSFKFAIQGNNIPMVEYLFGVEVVESTGLFIPQSVKMLDLFRRHGIEITPDVIMLGAMISGNYRLLDKVNSSNNIKDKFMVLNDNLEEDLISNIENVPGYMISLYLATVKRLSDDETLDDLITGMLEELTQVFDLYLIEVVLERIQNLGSSLSDDAKQTLQHELEEQYRGMTDQEIDSARRRFPSLAPYLAEI